MGAGRRARQARQVLSDPTGDFARTVRRRRMVRSFTDEPVAPATVDALLDLARRAPSAGHSQGVAFVVLEGGETARYWDVTLPPERRDTFRWPGLLRAPVLIVLVCSPAVYVSRYAKPDKAATGLGEGEGRWAVPYWWVDAGAVAQNLLLAVTDAGLGACLFGPFSHGPAVLDALGVPREWQAVATVAVGHPAPDEPGRSADRGWRPIDEVVHRGGWNKF